MTATNQPASNASMTVPGAGHKRLVIVGATGMVGGYALRYDPAFHLLNPNPESTRTESASPSRGSVLAGDDGKHFLEHLRDCDVQCRRNRSPTTPPSAEVATIEGNREPATDGGGSLMKSFQPPFWVRLQARMPRSKEIALRVGCRACSAAVVTRL
jgi:hypothetical protein